MPWISNIYDYDDFYRHYKIYFSNNINYHFIKNTLQDIRRNGRI